MSVWKIAWRSIQQRALSSSLTAFSMALGVALIVTVLVIYGVVRDSFQRNAQGYDVIVTTKGGKLQAVLNTVYHLGVAGEPLPYSYYEEFLDTPEKKGRYARYVAVAIPYCLGDNYQGYRVVGTTPQMFEKFEYRQGRRYEFSSGANFKQDDFFGAVIGALVARRTGLKVGDEFAPTHGITTGEEGHKHDPFIVRGILAPTGTPNDKALFINMEGFYLLEGHAGDPPKVPASPEGGDSHAHDKSAGGGEHNAEGNVPEHEGETQTSELHAGSAVTGSGAPQEHSEEAVDSHFEAISGHAHANEATEHDHVQAEEGHSHAHDHAHTHAPLPKSRRKVTAVLIRTANPIYGMSLPKSINTDVVAQAVSPQREIATLFEGIVGNVQLLLLLIAALVVVVAGIGIMVSMYNSMSDRRREIGIMRALGAARGTIVRVILIESLLLALAGGVAGFLLGHAVIGALNPWITDQTGVQIGIFHLAAPVNVAEYLGKLGEDKNWPVPSELVLIVGLAGLSLLVGILPAVAAYRTDVGKALSSYP